MPIQRPEVDRRNFSPETLKYHERITPFLNDTAAALNSARNFVRVNREPLRVKVPDDWVLLSPYIASGSGWTVNTAAGRPVAAIRKAMDGGVSLRGTLARGAGAPAAGSTILTWPTGYAPEGRQTFGFATNTGLGAAESTTAGYLYFSGGVATYPLDEVRFVAADRTPAAWGAPFPIFIPWTGTPTFLVVVAVRLDSAIRQTSERLTLPAWWSDSTQQTVPGFNLTRIPGLASNTTYNLTVYALPA